MPRADPVGRECDQRTPLPEEAAARRSRVLQSIFRMRWSYANALYLATNATLDDLREAVMTLEDARRTAQRVLGGTHPVAMGIEDALRQSRAALRARRSA